MLFDNPFFLRETRQHARRPLPLQAGLLAVAGGHAFLLLLLLYLWQRHGRGAEVPDPLLGLVVFPHAVLCAAAGVYGTDRIFGEEHRRSTLEGLFLLPVSRGRWLAQRLIWPLYLVAIAWGAGFPGYLTAALMNLGSPALNFRVSLFALAVGLLAVPLVLLLPPDYRERARAARTATAGQQRKVDADLLLCWAIVAGLVFLTQYSVMMGMFRGAGSAPFYGLRAPLSPVWALALGTVFLAAGAVAMATISREERWITFALRARLAAVAVLYYALLGLLLGIRWSVLPSWVQWGPAFLFPPVVWLVLRQQARPKEDPLGVGEVTRAEARWADPLVTRDLRSFTRFVSARRMIAGELAVLLGIYLLMVYLFVVKSGGSLAEVTATCLGLAAVFGTVILIADASARPYAMWTKERTSGTLPLLFLVPRSSRTLLRGRLIAGLLYSLVAHLPLLLLTLAGIAWLVASAWFLGPILLTFSPIAALFFVILGCTVQPQTGPPWTWHRDDWLEAGLAVVQLALLVVDAVVAVQWVRGDPAVVWPSAAGLFLLNAAVVYGCYRIRLRQFEALRTGDRMLSEK